MPCGRLPSSLPAKGDALLWTVHQAIIADDTFGRIAAKAVVRVDGARGAGGQTERAGFAVVVNFAAHQRELGNQRQQSAQRAEIAAPEAFHPPVEGDNHGEEEEERHGQPEERLHILKQRIDQPVVHHI